jgi:Ser/Thr protein kinase RdoA (MazF antagonist)
VERGWERAYPFRALAIPEAESLVRRVRPDLRVFALEPLAAGLRNSNFRVEVASGAPFVLRLYTADPSACMRECAILALLADRLPVPRVLGCEPTASPPVALFEWLDGTPLDEILRDADAETAREVAFACGSALASIQALRFDAPGFLGPDLNVAVPMPDWAPTVLSMAEAVETRLGNELVTMVRRAVEANAHVVELVWTDAVLVHADYKPWNLLGRFAGGDAGANGGPAPFELTGILDWEFSCAGCRLIDFGTFLRDERNRPTGFGAAFAAGYAAVGGSLPADWRRLTPLVDLLSLLQLASRSNGAALGDLRRLIEESLTRRD